MDPPSGGPEMLPKLPPIWMPQNDQPRQGFPGGEGFPRGGGYPGGGRGPPGGGWGPPPVPTPQVNHRKLVGEPPTIFEGD